ncbi:MAG: hypothetical protein IJA87_03045 [Clostridia bacterium]|nr:hypothetical protein [Clostridia bacterium]
MIIAAVLAGVYVVIGLINIPHCQNYPRFVIRVIMTLFYALELSLFAHRNSVYMEIGGDYALARRSCAGMIISLIVNAIVEAYYVSVFLQESGTLRLIYMCVIIVIACLTTLPLILFQYLNFEFGLMRIASAVSVMASLVSFCIGFLIIATNQLSASAQGVLATAGAVFDSFAPIYLIHCFVPIVVIEIARDAFVKQMKMEAKFAPEAPEGEPENEKTK